MSDVMTKESIVAVVETSKATSITGLWRVLKNNEKAKISGRESQKIRSIVPNIDEILKANVMAVVPETTADEPVVTAAVKEATAEVNEPVVKAVVTGNPYRPGSNRNIIFAEGSSKFWKLTELLSHLAKVTKQTKKHTVYQYNSVAYPDQNKNRSKQEFQGKGTKTRLVRLVRVK